MLAAIFAVFHLIVLGGLLLQSPQGGESFAFAFVAGEWPLLMLCLHAPFVGQYLCHGLSGDHYSVVLISGTLTYALIGFAIGAIIVWVRAIISRRGEGQDRR